MGWFRLSRKFVDELFPHLLVTWLIWRDISVFSYLKLIRALIHPCPSFPPLVWLEVTNIFTGKTYTGVMTFSGQVTKESWLFHINWFKLVLNPVLGADFVRGHDICLNKFWRGLDFFWPVLRRFMTLFHVQSMNPPDPVSW